MFQQAFSPQLALLQKNKKKVKIHLGNTRNLRDFFFFTLIFLKSAACFSNSAGLKMPLQATSPLEKTRNFEEKNQTQK